MGLQRPLSLSNVRLLCAYVLGLHSARSLSTQGSSCAVRRELSQGTEYSCADLSWDSCTGELSRQCEGAGESECSLVCCAGSVGGYNSLKAGGTLVRIVGGTPVRESPKLEREWAAGGSALPQ